MGCVQVKCCRTCSPTSDGDTEEESGVHPGPNNSRGLVNESLDVVHVPFHNLRLSYAVLSYRGHYPEAPEKENQDSHSVKTAVQGNPNIHFFGVFDGHGLCGTQCSSFVSNRLIEKLSEDPSLPDDPIKAYSSAFLSTNNELHSSKVDDSMSGTTAITALVIGDKLYVANVGDSRAVLGVREGDQILARDLSCDQTPFRKDECERVKLCGARVLSVARWRVLWTRVYSHGGMRRQMGGTHLGCGFRTGYTRVQLSQGVWEIIAEKIGVVADPEVSTVRLTDEHPFFVVASDGVFEFLSSHTVVDMVTKFSDPREACTAIADESYKLWLGHENRTDDITIIIVHIKVLDNL